MDLLNNAYLKIIFSSVSVYLFIIIAIRLFGKKELAQLSVFDLVFILLISNAVQNAMVGSDSSLIGGLIAAGSLFIVNYLFKYIAYKFPKFGKIVEGGPLMLIYHGKLKRDNMIKAKLSLDEIEESVREHGVRSIDEVDLAVLEMDGNISILSNEFKKKTTKKRRPRRGFYKND
jgi:uncharacterized membrane protein YcaP (DUF421 family)